MISLEEIRQTVMSIFQSAHATSYSGTLVNYPNLVVVDLDRQKDPFVSVEIELGEIEQSGVGESDIIVPGALRAYYYYRNGTGSSGGYIYADYLNGILGAQLIGALYFRPVQSMIVRTFPGWEGHMCTFQFDVVKALTCS